MKSVIFSIKVVKSRLTVITISLGKCIYYFRIHCYYVMIFTRCYSRISTTCEGGQYYRDHNINISYNNITITHYYNSIVISLLLLLLLYNVSLFFNDHYCSCATHLRITHRHVLFSRPQGLDSRIPWQAWRTDRTDARGTTCPRTAGRLSCPERRAAKDVGR